VKLAQDTHDALCVIGDFNSILHRGIEQEGLKCLILSSKTLLIALGTVNFKSSIVKEHISNGQLRILRQGLTGFYTMPISMDDLTTHMYFICLRDYQITLLYLLVFQIALNLYLPLCSVTCGCMILFFMILLRHIAKPCLKVAICTNLNMLSIASEHLYNI